jgi:hypothetical protein
LYTNCRSAFGEYRIAESRFDFPLGRPVWYTGFAALTGLHFGVMSAGIADRNTFTHLSVWLIPDALCSSFPRSGAFFAS